jgi:hypothetical protein
LGSLPAPTANDGETDASIATTAMIALAEKVRHAAYIDTL